MDERRSPKVLSLTWGEIEVEGVGPVTDAVLLADAGVRVGALLHSTC
ncbi:hypothetical protein [Catellatospora methionotrophica]